MTTKFYAIDFGTSNTVITRPNPVTEEAETVKLSGFSIPNWGENPPLIPSLIYVEDSRQEKILLGQEIRDRGLDLQRDPRFFANFKRGIGAKIQGFLPELDENIITFEKVGEWFLESLITNLTNQTGDTPESLVLTVPVDSFETYRHWLTDSCQKWGVQQIQILDEPTAAALGYDALDEDLLLVIDFGGGTIDLSLVQLDVGKKNAAPQGFILKLGEKLLGKSAAQKPKVARVLSKAGQNLGGSDLDNWILDYFVETHNLPKSSLTLRLCEKLKIQLSGEKVASEAYFNDETLDSYELQLEREKLEEILEERKLFAELDELMSKLLQQGRRNGIEKTDIGAVLLVGGSVQIPAVQEWVKKHFPEEKIKCDRPFDAIARGALKLAGGFSVKDFLYHSYGIRYWNRRQNRHGWHPIIKNGQSYPMDTSVELYLGASIENQASIELIIGELSTETGSTEVYFDGDRLVTRNISSGETMVQPLNDTEGGRTIAQLNPSGNPGSDRIKVKFWVDEKGFLRIEVEDLLTEATLLNNQIVAELS